MPSILNHETISTQLRDWAKTSFDLATRARTSEESRVLFKEGDKFKQILDLIEAQAEEIRVIRANHDQMCKDFDARNELLEREQQEHFLTKGTLMVREAELAEERKIYKAARPGTGLPKPEQRCEPKEDYWFGNAKLTGSGTESG